MKPMRTDGTRAQTIPLRSCIVVVAFLVAIGRGQGGELRVDLIHQPNWIGTGCVGLIPQPNAGGKLLQLGIPKPVGRPTRLAISALGPLAGDRLVRSRPIRLDYRLVWDWDFHPGATPFLGLIGRLEPGSVDTYRTVDPSSGEVFHNGSLVSGLARVPMMFDLIDVSSAQDFSFATADTSGPTWRYTAAGDLLWENDAGANQALVLQTGQGPALLTTGADGTALLDLQSGADIWRTSVVGSNVVRAQLDADVEPEVVVLDIQSSLVALDHNGQTLWSTASWSPFVAFRALLAVEREGGTGTRILAATLPRQLMELNELGEKIREINLSFSVVHLVAADVTQDGVAEFVAADRCDETNGGLSIVRADLSGILYQAPYASPPFDKFELANVHPSAGQELVQIVSRPDPQMVFFELANQSEILTIDLPMLPADLAIGQLDQDPASEIVVVGSPSSQPLILIEPFNSSDQAAGELASLNGPPNRVFIVDSDGDGIGELLLLNIGGTRGVRPQLLSSDGTEELWDGPIYSFSELVWAEVGQLDGDEGMELAFGTTHEGTFILDIRSRLLQGSHPGRISAGTIVTSRPAAIATYDSASSRLQLIGHDGTLRQEHALPLSTVTGMQNLGPDILLLSDGERLHEYRLGAQALTHSSEALAGGLATDRLRTARIGRSEVVLAGNSVGVWSAESASDPVFSDGFER